MLSVKNLTKIYKIKGKDAKQVVALNHVSIDFPETGMVFLLGKSGSGKSTLLNTIGGLDTFNDGEIKIKGKSSKDFKQSDFDAYRNTFIGFIFQEYNILEEFTIGKNLALALELQGKKADNAAVNALLDKVDLSGYSKRKPNQLSGGQKQRVAIARALIKDPEIIMADEPTGALDSNTGKQVMDTLKKLSKEKLVIIVSHDREFAEIYGDRVIELKDGSIISDTTKHKVEAERSSSGVSFIDDKIVHIKKGQKINKEDLIKINQMIIDNAEKQDTIISFDDKPNQEIKRTAFITEDGNREVFKTTTKEDVSLKNYDPNQFKLIHSKMKIVDAFKMGSSSLKHKPIRLFFTILLSFVAFAMFGLADTMASYDVATSTYESIKMTKTNNLVIGSVEYDEYGYKNDQVMTAGAQKAIIDKHKNYTFYKVINPAKSSSYSSASYNLTNATYKDSSGSSYSYGDSIYSRNLAGILPLDDSVARNLKLQLLIGDYPTADDEIVISEHMFDCIKRTYKDIETFANLSGKLFYSDNGSSAGLGGWVNSYYDDENNYVEGHYAGFKIVGIVKNTVDISNYTSNNEKNSDNASMSDYMKYTEIRTLANYGLLNMAYVSPAYYNSLAATYTTSREFYYYVGDNKPSYNSYMYTYNFYTYEDMVKNFEIYKKDIVIHPRSEDPSYTETVTKYYLPGKGDTVPDDAVKVNAYESMCIEYKKAGADLSHLSNNQIIVNESKLKEGYKGDTTDLDYQALLDGGLKFKLTNRNGDVVQEFDVVAISNQYTQLNKYDDGSYYDYGTSSYVYSQRVEGQTYGYAPIVITAEMYTNLFSGCDYLITSLKDTNSDAALVRDLVTYNQDGNGYTIKFTATSQLDSFASMIVSMKDVFLYTGIGFAVFASFLLMNFISISVNFKKREIGVLRAIGAGKKDVFSIFFSESFVIAVINFILATIATFIAAFFINRSLYNDLGFKITLLTVGIRQIALLLAVSLGVAFISTLLPVYKIARKNPVDSINNR